MKAFWHQNHGLANCKKNERGGVAFLSLMSFYAVVLIIAEPAKVTITVKTTHPSRGLSQVPQNQMQMDNCQTTPKHVHVHHPTTQAGKEHSRIQCNESLLTTMCDSFKKQYIAYVTEEPDLRRVMGEEIRGTGQ